MKNSSALGVLSYLFEERGVGLQTLDGFGDVGNRKVSDDSDTHVDTSYQLVDHPN
jgi:hypothetical protein